MLRFITKKFKSQSLNEVQPVDCQVINVGDMILEQKTDGSPKERKMENMEIMNESLCQRIVESMDIGKYTFSPENKENLKYVLCEQCRDLQQSSRFPENTVPECSDCLQSKLNLNKRSASCYSLFPCQSPAQSQHGEKRKYSSTTHYNKFKVPALTNNNCDSGSSDDEIKDLCSKYKCVSSSDKVSPNSMLWKRRIVCIDRVGAARPSLNFEKMQQKLFKRSRPRVVKIKTVASLSSNELTDLIAFKPINIMNITPNQLIPVEEPSGYVF